MALIETRNNTVTLSWIKGHGESIGNCIAARKGASERPLGPGTFIGQSASAMVRLGYSQDPEPGSV